MGTNPRISLETRQLVLYQFHQLWRRQRQIAADLMISERSVQRVVGQQRHIQAGLERRIPLSSEEPRVLRAYDLVRHWSLEPSSRYQQVFGTPHEQNPPNLLKSAVISRSRPHGVYHPTECSVSRPALIKNI
ncbi:unnamed protein product [Mycena citricolor]|uniref:Uncharacterized protein n=1 Tax=Mycena citricolor TaxID=2018698 RepID=A0AAD2K0J7_9AGAR|nr:unnamed protein product [Mycena citricolor]